MTEGVSNEKIVDDNKPNFYCFFRRMQFQFW